MSTKASGWYRSEDLIGETLGRYRIVRLVGEGGMGAVYEATHLRLNKRVAIKVLHPRLAADDRQCRRFLREARAANRIANRHVVEILDFGDEPVTHFVMEFLAGVNLRRLVRTEGPLPWARARPVMLAILDALGAAHAEGVIHRDVKPSNVFLQRDSEGFEEIKVLDFGIAKVTEPAADTDGLTRPDEVVGTVAYMAPEQAMGGEVDARTDVYAAGIVLFEMLTGRPPFAGASDYQLLDAHVNQAPPTVRSLNPSVPVAVEAVVSRALQKNPDDRFQTMRKFAWAVRRVPDDGVLDDGVLDDGVLDDAAGSPTSGDRVCRPGEIAAPQVELDEPTEAWVAGSKALPISGDTVIADRPLRVGLDDSRTQVAAVPTVATEPPDTEPKTLSTEVYSTSPTATGMITRRTALPGWSIALAVVLTLGAAAGAAALLTHNDAEPRPAKAAATQPVVSPQESVEQPEFAVVVPATSHQTTPPTEHEPHPEPESPAPVDVIIDDDDDHGTESKSKSKPKERRKPKATVAKTAESADRTTMKRLRAKAAKACAGQGSVAVSFQVMHTGKTLLVKTQPKDRCIADIVAAAQFGTRDKPQRKTMTVNY